MKRCMKRCVVTIAALGASCFIIFVVIFLLFPATIVDFYISPYDPFGYAATKDVFIEVRPLNFSFQFTDTKRHKSHLTWSPHQQYVAFFEDVRDPSDATYNRETAVQVLNPRTFRIKTIFIGTYHTSNYEWRNDHMVRVYVSEGTGVRRYRDISVFVKEPFVDIEHDPLQFWTGQYNAKYREGGEDWRE